MGFSLPAWPKADRCTGLVSCFHSDTSTIDGLKPCGRCDHGPAAGREQLQLETAGLCGVPASAGKEVWWMKLQAPVARELFSATGTNSTCWTLLVMHPAGGVCIFFLLWPLRGRALTVNIPGGACVHALCVHAGFVWQSQSSAARTLHSMYACRCIPCSASPMHPHVGLDSSSLRLPASRWQGVAEMWWVCSRCGRQLELRAREWQRASNVMPLRQDSSADLYAAWHCTYAAQRTSNNALQDC